MREGMEFHDDGTLKNAADHMRSLMTGPHLPRELALSNALADGKLATRAVFAGSAAPIGALMELLRLPERFR